MSRLLFLAMALLTAGAAQAFCESVYDSVNARWVYACAIDPQKPPVCHSEYDPVNRQWVLVCQ